MTSVDDTLANQSAGEADRGDGPGPYQPFAHLTTEHSVLYRQVMRVFVRAKREFSVHLRPEDVHLVAG